MRKFKLPVTSGNLVELINEMRTGAAAKLSAFCSQQILDKRLSTKTFKYDFDIAGRRSGGQRKSVQKLREILLKHVKKQVSYLEYVRSGDAFMTVHSSRSNQIAFKLESPFFKVSITNEDYDLTGKVVASKWARGILRYSRFLNYKAIQSGTPLNCSVENLNFEISPDDLADYENWCAAGTRDRVGITLKLRASAKFTVKIAAYEYPGFTQSRPPGVNTYSEFESYLAKMIGPSRDIALSAYRNSSNWRARDLAGISYVNGDYSGSEKYYTAEKIFLALDEMIKVIVTLTRRVQYDAAAFNIGSTEAS